MPIPLDPAPYQALLNETFTLHHPEGDRPIKLSEVKVKIDDEIQFCFLVHFTGHPPALSQGIHRLSHPKLGEIDLFLVPIQSRKPGILYEAVFNLLKDTGQ